jgi:hypothetical protein
MYRQAYIYIYIYIYIYTHTYIYVYIHTHICRQMCILDPIEGALSYQQQQIWCLLVVAQLWILLILSVHLNWIVMRLAALSSSGLCKDVTCFNRQICRNARMDQNGVFQNKNQYPRMLSFVAKRINMNTFGVEEWIAYLLWYVVNCYWILSLWIRCCVKQKNSWLIRISSTPELCPTVGL